MKYLLLVVMVFLGGCEKKEEFTLGWGPRGNFPYRIMAGEFDSHDRPIGKYFECDDDCKKVWEKCGMSVAMNDLMCRKAQGIGYRFRKEK